METPARNSRDWGMAQPPPPQPCVEGAGSLQPHQPALHPACVAEELEATLIPSAGQRDAFGVVIHGQNLLEVTVHTGAVLARAQPQ